MPYEHRFGNCGKRNDARHDPSHSGIFIHGGTCFAGPFARHWELKMQANRFSITIPTTNGKGEEIPLEKTHQLITGFPKPTFMSALEHAKQLRQAVPALQCCPIFACTDLHMVTRCSGEYKVQRVA